MLFLALYNKIDLTNLTPIFGTGYKQVFIAGGLRLGAFNSLFILFILGNYIDNIKKCIFSSLGSVVAIAMILIFLLFTIFSHSALAQNSFAIFELTRMVSFGRFFQRIESIFALLWIMVACIFLSISLYIALDIFKQVFNIRYYKRIIPCTSLLVFVGSLLIPDYTFSINVRKILYTYVSPILFFAYPLIILIFAKVKSSGGNNEINE